MIAGTPTPARITVRPDRTFTFELRTPPTAHLLMTAAGVKEVKGRMRGAGATAGPRSRDPREAGKVEKKQAPKGNTAVGCVGEVSLKHVYEIAKIKQSEPRLSALSLQSLVKSLIWQAGSMGISVVP